MAGAKIHPTDYVKSGHQVGGCARERGEPSAVRQTTAHWPSGNRGYGNVREPSGRAQPSASRREGQERGPTSAMHRGMDPGQAPPPPTWVIDQRKEEAGSIVSGTV
ncbi:hypothetical protein B0T14DRAFT_13433 [Immersiella caudata]|uniref:Uncharacterized protein n=1 Tax=Immersiella caudata TaxID=314043 RepID=A0AA40CB43_9PEZI|nr:hypothetical protein B0T14DRAFT_13433 [Immersiella caudata]